jgi:hypothetical protein
VTQVDFEVTGEDIAAKHLLETAIRAKDLRPASRKIRDLLTAGNARNFAAQGAVLGQTWPPLAPSTLARKQGGEIGVRTGALRTSIQGGRGRSTSATKTQVKVGTKVWYARFFAGGTKSGQPPRPIVGATRSQISVANAILSHWITEGF